MDAFILRSIYPKLSQCLAEFIINPHQQHLGMKQQKYQFSLLSFTCRSPVRYGVLIKGLCQGCPVYFVFNAIYESLFAMKLDKLPVNDKITSFVSNKVCLPSIISIVTNNNNELWKTVGLKKTTLAIRFNLLQVSPSMPPFVFSVSFIPSSNFLELLFNVSLNLMAVRSLRILMNFVAQLMVTMILSTCSRFNPLSPNSDQHQFSPNIIHTLSRDKVMRINKMIIIEKIPWSFIKFSQLILKVDVWRSVWRICMWILGLDIILIS